jgi:hypothetical protein
MASGQDAVRPRGGDRRWRVRGALVVASLGAALVLAGCGAPQFVVHDRCQAYNTPDGAFELTVPDGPVLVAVGEEVTIQALGSWLVRSTGQRVQAVCRPDWFVEPTGLATISTAGVVEGLAPGDGDLIAVVGGSGGLKEGRIALRVVGSGSGN